MVKSYEEIGPGDVPVRKRTLDELLTCSICNNIFNEPVNITECLHIFCNRCISKKIQEEDLSSCPVCNVYLGCVPLDKLRPDHNWTSIREALFPSLGKAEEKSGKQDDEIEYKESELLKGEAEQPNTLHGRRKQKSLSSLENKINISAGSATRIQNPHKSVGRRRKSIARKAFPSAAATRTQNPHKPVEAHSQSKRFSMNINNCAEDDKQSSEQQIPTIGRERTQRSDKKIELVNNLLKPLDDIAEAGKLININKTFSEGDTSSKLMNISSSEGQSSEKNLRSYNADAAIRSTPPSLPALGPVRKNRGRPKKIVEPQGLVCAQTIVNAASIQHAKRVVPIWLSLVPAVNQEGVEPLPQIPRCFLMIRNGTQTISFIKKYLVLKLGLNREDEVELSLWGMRLPHDMQLRQLVDLWSQAMPDSEKVPTMVGDSAEGFVMVLTYGRKRPHH